MIWSTGLMNHLLIFLTSEEADIVYYCYYGIVISNQPCPTFCDYPVSRNITMVSKVICHYRDLLMIHFIVYIKVRILSVLLTVLLLWLIVVPIKDTHQLYITWCLPPVQHLYRWGYCVMILDDMLPCVIWLNHLIIYYRVKPLHYLGWLVGHEGTGSIMSLLKQKWVNWHHLLL